MIEVLFDGYGSETLKLLSPDPIRSLGKAEGRGRHLTCTALQDFHVNVFTVYSPFTVTYKFNRDQNNIHVDGDNVLHKGSYNDDGSVELQMYPQYVLRASEGVLVQLLPPLLAVNKLPAYVASGEFDISKWYRPINTAFIVPNDVNELTIKEGEPLFSLRFVTKNNEPVKLIRQALSKEEETLVNACMNVTNYKLGTKLSKLYELFDKFKQSLKPRKCPFHW